MPKEEDMGSRIYEHYLQYGSKAKKKLKSKTFRKRYGWGKLKRKTPRTKSVLRDIGSGLTEAEKRRMTD